MTEPTHAPTTAADWSASVADDDGTGPSFRREGWTWRQVADARPPRRARPPHRARGGRPDSCRRLDGEHARISVPAGRGGPGRRRRCRGQPHPTGHRARRRCPPGRLPTPYHRCRHRHLLDGLDLGLVPTGSRRRRRRLPGRPRRPRARTDQDRRRNPAHGRSALTSYLHIGLDRRAQGRPHDPGPGRPIGGPRRLHSEDVLYSAMPLFHGNALSAAVLPAFASGATLALRRKFSASNFLPDIRETEPRSSTASGGRSPTSWPPRPTGTTATTSSVSCWVRRRRLRTRRSSPSASVSPSSRGTARAKTPSCSSQYPTPDRAHWAGPARPMTWWSIDPDERRGTAPRALQSRTASWLNADECIGELVGRSVRSL